MIDFVSVLRTGNYAYVRKMIDGKFKNCEKELKGVNVLEKVYEVFKHTSKLTRSRREFLILYYLHLLHMHAEEIVLKYVTGDLDQLGTDGPLDELTGGQASRYQIGAWEEFDPDFILPRPCQVLTKGGKYNTGWYWPSDEHIAGYHFNEIAKVRHLELRK